ncbi:hypothetical protein H0255_10575 [Pectobacterium versatile]|jgi:hypothetical protein|uniref:hypothetical protein n=2 Tax=Pectobacterium versatile TaxID=2488639 RepID=UPI000D616A58|nr:MULTISPECIES: hypothetical protein [Pectobacterium]MBA0163582.1 hypothetical protein [Pectobacterium versatile]MBD0848144.1 hypothetical protein [Pectobacterium carotovorum subsp. carotovorum]MBK4824340.1 hypothetical protein [Pectobacterium carotovorum subsp. carotovorum]MBN3062084.1 hypothetical protein [Pectobacterium versatile]MBN3237765.1 hypothetical protein [Pectobacterium versatile]
MRVILVISIAMLLSGCMVTKTIDNNSPTLVRSSSSQRVGILMPNNANVKYCPDAPADTAKTFDGTMTAELTDKLGNDGKIDTSLKTAIVDLAKRNTTTNVLVYSLNSLCFLSMNGELSKSEVASRFDTILKVVGDIAKTDKENAEAKKAEEQLKLNKFNKNNNIIER